MTALPQSEPEALAVGPLEVIPVEHLARVNGSALMLSVVELRMLTELLRRADRIVSREELSTRVWGRELRPGDRSVDVYVHKLRVKLEAALPGWSFIHTHFGLGYRLCPQPRKAAPRLVPERSRAGS
ncbi:MAG: winged helix-turn-helix transcriptional regulator [Solirubrobacterales bacterium]|nr:winged helix-turn-helix transcriptional regulator [Solirubrobacterales bacterium]